MPIAPSDYMRHNYGGYAQTYDSLASQWDKLPSETKRNYPMDQYLADAMMGMFGTTTDYASIDKQIGMSQAQPIGPESMAYRNESGGSMPSYNSPFGNGWYKEGVYDVPTGGLAYNALAVEPHTTQMRFDRDVNPAAMYMSPYDPQNWDRIDIGKTAGPGFFKENQDKSRRDYFDKTVTKLRDRSLAGTDLARRIIDRVRRGASGHSFRR